jgi:hypothetical protein
LFSVFFAAAVLLVWKRQKHYYDVLNDFEL